MAGLVSIFPQKSYAQLTLPKSELLAEKGVKKNHVTKTAIRMENRYDKDVSEEALDRTPMKLATYTINAQGSIDTFYNYHGDTIRYNQIIYRYAFGNRLTELNTLSPTGDLIKGSLVVKTPENEWYYRVWQNGELEIEIKSTSDSIVYESIWHRNSKTSNYYRTTTYDIDKDIQTESTFVAVSNELIRQETYQWIATDGVPEKFLYTDFYKGDKKEKARNKTYTLKVDKDGTVINNLNGLFTDPFGKFNYFKRYERFKGIPNPHERLLTEDTLIREK